MIGLGLCILAFACTFVAGRRSLVAGLQMLLVVGYAYGLCRGRLADGFTHFLFDAALFALYIAYFSERVTPPMAARSSEATLWVRVLAMWPVMCIAFSPLLSDPQPLVIQLVGLRGAVLMLPCIILGARLQKSDFDRLAPTVAILNLIALVFTGIEYVYGISAIVPENIATEMIYMSRDIHGSGELYHRIPSVFINAHVYGGAMLMSIPFLLHGLETERRTRLLCVAALAAAGIGVFACGARTPVVLFGVTTAYSISKARMRLSTLLGFALVGAILVYLVMQNERFQRFETLSDTDYVQERVASSVNTSFLNLVGAYPMGGGLASAFGTSIPFFMSNIAHPVVGIENEYGHLLVEQGIPGLALWIVFIVRLLTSKQAPVAAPVATSFMTALVVGTWAMATLGVGTLTSIPTTALFLCFCGVRLAIPTPEKARLALRHVAPRRDGPFQAPSRAVRSG